DGSEYRAHVVIVATGTNERTLGFEKDDALLGHGLSYCAVCDGLSLLPQSQHGHDILNHLPF
ncbi:hypothetical protein PT115_09095, partial [Erysipelothrix rhusiopathiae]|nr:hypothetical protein [Erysipelothrix rhusiopathiae]